jgi:hypothetical protein
MRAGGLGGRVLRLGRPRQVRVPHGVRGDDARVGGARVREGDGGRQQPPARARCHPLGHQLLRQGPHRAQQPLGPGTRHIQAQRRFPAQLLPCLQSSNGADHDLLQVGDGDSDHLCWERAEDMSTPRTAFKINMTHPGSEVAGETAAALAAASKAFRPYDSMYADLLLLHAKQVQ